MSLGTRTVQHLSKPDEENPYWISFSDIMAGLLIIFVLASLVLIYELTKTKVQVNEAILELAKAEEVRRQIVLEVKDELATRGIDVEVSDNHTVIRIPETTLAFDSNRHDIPSQPSTQESVAYIGEVLYNTIEKEQRWSYLDTIFVEGHTDILPSPLEMGNWGLSTFRAISVWNFWAESQTEDEQLATIRNHAGEPLFSVSGYGETRPITASQGTREERKQNRRIDLRITVKKPAVKDFEALREMLQ